MAGQSTQLEGFSRESLALNLVQYDYDPSPRPGGGGNFSIIHPSLRIYPERIGFFLDQPALQASTRNFSIVSPSPSGVSPCAYTQARELGGDRHPQDLLL